MFEIHREDTGWALGTGKRNLSESEGTKWTWLPPPGQRTQSVSRSTGMTRLAVQSFAVMFAGRGCVPSFRIDEFSSVVNRHYCITETPVLVSPFRRSPCEAARRLTWRKPPEDVLIISLAYHPPPSQALSTTEQVSTSATITMTYSRDGDQL